MALDIDLIAPRTRLVENGFSAPVEIRASQTRTFFCLLMITEQIEQESVDISIWGSRDGENWSGFPILKLPQQFYCGETRAVLDLHSVPEVNFIRAGWELNRWGRVAPTPFFELGLKLVEVPAMPVGASSVPAAAAK